MKIIYLFLLLNYKNPVIKMRRQYDKLNYFHFRTLSTFTIGCANAVDCATFVQIQIPNWKNRIKEQCLQPSLHLTDHCCIMEHYFT